MAGRNQGRDVGKTLEDFERRLARLERLVFLAFQDTRDVAEYAYESVFTDPEELKRLSWTHPTFKLLTDQEALTGAGLAIHELAALKMTMRVLRRQGRRDVLGIIRDLVRRSAERPAKTEEAA